MEESSDSYDSSTDDSDSPPASLTEEATAQKTTSQEHPSEEKRARKPRKPNKLTNDTFKITKIDGRGVPVSPLKHAKGFSNAVGCIVRETVKITCMDLRGKDKENLREMLFNRLFNRYTFQNDEMQRQVRHRALGMMTKALNTWRNTVNKMKDQDFEEVIKKRWPQIEEEDWKHFLASHTGDDFKKKSSLGKEMRENNILNHNLGSRGYLGKKKIWAKEDAAAIKAGKQPPFSYIEAGRGRDFVRARASYDPVTGEPVFKSIKLVQVHDKLMNEPQTQSSLDSVDRERWEDPLGKALGGVEHRGSVRGVGVGAPWKVYLPEDKEVGRERRRSRSTARLQLEFDQRVAAVAEETVRRILAEQGHQTMHPNTDMLIPPDVHTESPNIGGPISTSASVSRIPVGSLNPIDDITDLTPCHLLAPMMDGKMVTVAHGRVHPMSKENKLHCVDLPPDMAKVDVNKVLDPFIDLDVHGRHPEPGCNKLGECKGYVMKWPKDAIKLAGKSTRTIPQYSSKATTPANEVGICAPLTYEDMDGAQGEEDQTDQDQGVGSNSYVAPKHCAAKKRSSPDEATSPEPQHVRIKKKKDKAGKKEQKLKKSLSYGSTNAIGERESGKWRKHHIRGERLVPEDEFESLSSNMKALHQNIRVMEISHEGHASHYTARVPEDYHHFVTKYPADKFYLEIPEIFRMFNLDLLESSLVRLWALYLVRETRQNKELANVGVADPIHMHEDNLSCDEGVEIILRECIFPALQHNKDKKYILVPYNPKGHWVLIILMVKECKAFYLDSLKNQEKRDYTVLSQILDDALFEHSLKGGIVPRKGKGRVHFKHYTDVSCTQQQDSVSCGYYLCYHMDIFVRSQKTLNKGVDIQLFGTSLESNPFALKKEFTRIQDIFAKIINTEVASESGLFYGGDESLEVHDLRTKAAATHLIKHA